MAARWGSAYKYASATLATGVFMNFNRVIVLAAAFLLAGFDSMSAAQSDQYFKFLGVADVQKLTGVQEIKLVPKNEDADGDLNFARADGQILLSVSFYPADAYASARSSQSGFKSALKGVGEEAFVGPAAGPPLFILAFRQGNYTVVLNTELDAKSKPVLTIEQITAIGKLIASRM